MLNLALRSEFLTSQMRGTQIDLDEFAHRRPASDILAITYPTADLRAALRAIADPSARPAVLIGERGLGKSHILSLLHHAFANPTEVEQWAKGWSGDIADPQFAALSLPAGYSPISAQMGDQEYLSLWEPIWAGLKDGQRLKGKFEGSQAPVPARSLMEEAFTGQPAALIFDELQTWFEALGGDLTGGSPRAKAFNFIQILAELAASRPDILRLIVSVRNSETEAYRQVHRSNPVLVDFKGAAARQDRIRLTQHRLFENRRQIPRAHVEAVVSSYADERVRLLFPTSSGPAADDLRRTVADTWPFAPELLQVLEDDILMAAAAQQNRDMLRILARMYRARGEKVPLLTVADVDVTQDAGGSADLASMVDAIADGARLRQVAQRNLDAVNAQGLPLAHARELVSALWVRSLTQGPQPGATPAELQLDVTRDVAMDDNAFTEELTKLQEASFNIHPSGNRLVFRVEENPRARLLASARNNNLFPNDEDLAYLQRAAQAALQPINAATATVSRLVVLGEDWETRPWDGRAPEELPAAWREPVVLVLPEVASEAQLARFLKDKVTEKRNLVRFLTPPSGGRNPYRDQELRETGRCAYLAEDWARTEPQYALLRGEYQGTLRKELPKLFERLAVLRTWDYGNPSGTRFDFETVAAGSQGALSSLEEQIATKLFDGQAFRDYVKREAAKSRTAYDILTDLMEPPTSPSETAVPYLGETALYDKVLEMAAKGEVALNVNATWVRREPSDPDDAMALARIRSRAFKTGRDLQSVLVALPSAVPAAPLVAAGPSGASGAAAATGNSTQPPISSTNGGMTYSTTAGATSKDGAQPRRRTLASSGARTAINLLGDVHSWSLPSGPLPVVRLQAEAITAAQLKTLLQKLPIDVKLKLEIDVDESTVGGA